jgi:NAD(P)-dependent dehydrogenase (short-subunit alcohol dehydrogenase family)
MGRCRAIADIDTDEFDRGIRTNMRGTFLGTRHKIPATLASGGGVVVNMASVAAVTAMTNLAAGSEPTFGSARANPEIAPAAGRGS